MPNYKKGDVIALGSDHGGFQLKQEIIKHLEEKGIEYKDFGSYTPDSIDYPEIAEKVCNSVVAGQTVLGILVCGTGIGMSMAANKCKGIRAAACSETFSTKFTRLHNDANVLCLGGRVIGPGVALEIVDLFIGTDFEGGRHERRVNALMEIENK